MWGNAFSDLAKKAQEIQEQAKEQASHIAAPTFFNLDAMQGDGTAESREMFTTPQPSNHGHGMAARPSTPHQQSNNRNDDSDLDGMIHEEKDPFAAFDSLPTIRTVQPKTKTPIEKVAASSPLYKSSHVDDDNERVNFDNKTAVSSLMPETTESIQVDAVPSAEADSAEASDAGGGWEEDDGLLDIVESNSEKDVQETTVIVDTGADGNVNEDAVDMEQPIHHDDDDALEEPETVMETTADEDKSLWNEDDGANVQEAKKEQQPLQSTVPFESNAVHDFENESLDEEAVVHLQQVNGGDMGETKMVSMDTAFNQNPLLLPVEEALSQQNHVEEIVTESETVNHAINDTIVGLQNVDERDISDAKVMNGSHAQEEAAPTPVNDVLEEVVTEPRDDDDDAMAPEVPSDQDDQDNGVSSQDVGDFEIGSPESAPVDAGAIDAVPEYEDTVEDTNETNEHVSHQVERDIDTHEELPKEVLPDGSIDKALPYDTHDAEDATKSVRALPVEEEMNESVNDSMQHPSLDAGEQVNEEVDAIPPATQSQQQLSEAPSPIVPKEEYEQELQRLRKVHQTEIAKLKEEHESQMQEALNSFNHDHCESERREVEVRFMNQIRGKEEHLQELMRENEGCKLRIDALTREVTGTQALLEQRDSTMGSVSASHNKNVELLEQRIQELNNAKSLAKAETDRVKEELQATKVELGTSNEAYSSLKARVKVVATELKERRVECRSLAGTVTELKQSNEELETQIINLQSQLSDRDRTQTQKDKDVIGLREQIESLELELHRTRGELKDRDSVGEKALASYKKKAQNALAVANARAAAANQAKEEAELEATTAKTMSEEAIHRARVTEDAGNKALAEAKEYVREMETEKQALEKTLAETTENLEKTTTESEHLKNSLDASRAAQEKLVEDVKLLTHDREQERGKNRDLQQQLDENQRKLELLYEEVESLREELRQANAIVASSSNDNSEKESRPTAWTHPTRTSEELPDRSDAEGTIAMLEGDLRDANRAIKELKDALKNAIAEQGSNGYGNGIDHSPAMSHHHANPRQAASSGPAGNESTPLFYAMEKQAELNTARDEINRLANLLGDAESSKMEAYDAMDEMRRRMEEAEARLHRQEKFEGAAKPTTTAKPSADENANLEYLKNIMLSYLNAKTLAEKKALVPVIAAVLCLTPEEQATAVKNLEESGGIEGIGKSLFESIGGSLSR